MNSGSKKYNIFSCSSTTLLLLLIRLLSSSIYSVEAQASPPPDDFDQYARFSPSMAIIVVVLVAALFFMGFFSIYIRRCSDGGPSARPGLSIHRAGRLAAASRGLDAAVLETFPTFVYSTVKGLKVGKGALECAVCLNEFDDEETIRLIPKCDHVFHAECIDAWLENHVTCPVCRCNLVQLSGDSTESPENNPQIIIGEFNGENSPTVVIPVGDENVPHRNPVLDRVKSATASRAPRSRSVRAQDFFQKFRSHSTGHSLIQAGENTERFTLRLPEEVRKKVINDALLHRSSSTIKLTGEESGRKGYRTGESSSNRRSYRRMGSLDRPVFSRAPSFLARAFSSRSQKGVSGNGGSSEMTSDKIPLNNIGLKSDDGDGGGGYRRPPV